MAVEFDDFPTAPNSGPSLTLGTELNNRFNALKAAINSALSTLPGAVGSRLVKSQPDGTLAETGITVETESITAHSSATNMRRGMGSAQHGNNAYGGTFSATKGRGTQDTPTAVQAGDNIGVFNGYAHDGTDYRQGNGFRTQASENHGAGVQGQRAIISTIANGTTAQTDSLIVEHHGVLLPAFSTTARDALPTGELTTRQLIFNTDNARFEFWNGASWKPVDDQRVELSYALSDESTAITAGTAKITVRMPFAMKVTEVRASLSTAGAITVDINENGVSILSTKLSVDSGEKTSLTANTPAVISDPDLSDDAEITFDVDATDGNAKGLKVTIIGVRA